MLVNSGIALLYIDVSDEF